MNKQISQELIQEIADSYTVDENGNATLTRDEEDIALMLAEIHSILTEKDKERTA